MEVYVDGRQLEGVGTGVATWLGSILGGLDAADRRRLIVLTRGALADPPPVEVRPLQWPSALWHVQAALCARRAGAAYLSPDSFLVPLLLGRRATLVVHDLTPLLLPAAHTWRSRVSHRALLRLALWRAGSIVVPSATTADDVTAFAPRVRPRLRVIAEAARPLPEPEGATPSTPYLLYVGTVEPRKNVDALIRAFTSAAPEGWCLAIAGKLGWLDDLERREIESLVAADPRVELLGFVSDARLATLYDGAGAFAYPSAYEGFGLPVLEAMARGVPAIISDAPALVEVAGDAALVAGRTALEAELREAIAQLLSDEALRGELTERGRRRASLFSWERAAREVMVACGVASSATDDRQAPR